MSENLKPCPFCNGEASAKFYTSYLYRIVCANCGAATGEGNYDEVVLQWNTRSPDSLLYALIDQENDLNELFETSDNQFDFLKDKCAAMRKKQKAEIVYDYLIKIRDNLS